MQVRNSFRIVIASTAMLISATPLSASSDATSSYAGQQTRNIKALSADELAGYLQGKGLGLAKAAELNHYPGPRHVLDLAKELSLSEKQITQSQAIFDAMQGNAVELGKQLIHKEQELDQKFAQGSIDPASLKTLTEEIGNLQAKIRFTHLSAHLEQMALLTSHQIHKYDQLRGYGENARNTEHRHSH